MLRFSQARWAFLATASALLAVALFAFQSDLASARPKTKPPLSLTISPKQYRLSVKVSTKPQALCTLAVSSDKKSATLPKLRANRSGAVTFTWGVPPNAPSGTWTFSVSCVRAGKTYRLKKSSTILTGGNGTAGVIEWDSLSTQTPGKGAGIPVVRVAVPDKRGLPDPGNDYPAALLGPQDSVEDQWDEYNRECTSFVAWALATRNGFNTPFYDNASGWGPDARARGYVVNSTPAEGSVAWDPAGHVAYVENVVGGDVQIEEYNHGYPTNPGTYDTRTVPAGNFQYIHFADVGPSSGAGNTAGGGTPGGGGATGGGPVASGAVPAAVVNSADTNMNVFYRDTSGNLVNEYWTNTGGWVHQVLASGMTGDPAAVQNSDTNINVFYRDTSGNLVNEYWTNTGGWVHPVLASGMAGNAAAVVNGTDTNMNVFYRDTSGNLVNEYWTNTGGWVHQVLASGMTGDPAAIQNSDTNINVFYCDSSGNLVNEYWTSTGGWVHQTLASGVAGDPAAVVNSATNMNVFYRDSSGNLVNEYWTNTGGWVNQVLASGMAGNAAAVVNSATNMNVFYRDSSGNLVNEYWTNTGGWVHQVLASGMAGDPAAVVNGATNMNVFYENGALSLINEYWANTGGWVQQTLP